MQHFDLLIYLTIGLIAITFIDTIGAIASRKMNFKYVYLSILSFATYIILAYVVSRDYQLLTVIFVNATIGLYDSTVGFWFSIRLNANNGLTTAEASEMLGIKSSVTMVALTIVLSLMGSGLSSI